MEKIKRTRVLPRGQSNRGCITCKSRKVKCDEMKPHCLRCFQSRIQCKGYAPNGRASQDHIEDTPAKVLLDSSLSLQYPSNFKAYLDPALLSHVGMSDLLEFDDTLCPVGQKAWKHLLEGYANTSPGARAACIVYGAAKEIQSSSSDPFSYLKDIYGHYYGLAVSLLRDDIKNSIRLLSAITTCLLLCSVELLFRRRRNALKHVKAVFEMAGGGHHFFPSMLPGSSPTSNPITSPPEIASDFRLLLQVLDIQVLSYTEGSRLASMEVYPLYALESYTLAQDLNSLTEGDVVQTIHTSYAFIAKSTHREISGISAEELHWDRNRLLDILEHAILLIDSLLPGEALLPNRTSWAILRNFCLGLSALLKNLFCLREEEWTLESKKLERIVTSAEDLIVPVGCQTQTTHKRQQIRFMPQLGIIPPLYLAALKHRDSSWRRRAIRCLRTVGLEGPWTGAMSAAIAERCMDIEEATPNKIPNERSMVSRCYTMDDNGNNDGRIWPTPADGTTTMKVIRRLQPAPIMETLLPRLSNSEASSDIDLALDPLVWECWTERIEFSPAGHVLA